MSESSPQVNSSHVIRHFIYTIVCCVVSALLFCYISWTLPVIAIGLVIPTLLIVSYFLVEYLFNIWKGTTPKLIIYLFHHPKSFLGISYQMMIIFASIAVSLFLYQKYVDACYRNVSKAYSKVNVFRDSLQMMPLASWKKDTSVGETPRIETKQEAQTCFLEILRDMKLIDPEEFLKKDVSGNGLDYSNLQNQDAIRWLMDNLFPTNSQATERFSTNSSTLGLLIDIASSLSANKQDVTKYKQANINVLASVLSGEPEAYVVYRDKLYTLVPTSDKPIQDYEKMFVELKKQYGENFSVGNIEKSDNESWRYFCQPLHYWLNRGFVPDDKQVVNLLFIQERVLNGNANLYNIDEQYDEISNNSDKLNRADILFIQQFCLELLSRTHDNSNVKFAKTWLSIILGPEQLFMLIVFFLCMFHITGRFVLYCVNTFRYEYLPLGKNPDNVTETRSKIIAGIIPNSQKRKKIIELMNDQMLTFVDQVYPTLLDINQSYSSTQGRERNSNIIEYLDYQMSYFGAMEQRSRWIINWAVVTLPAIGFIGTVRGMLLALGNADSIVRASTSAAQAAAITDVATQLSLAFTTTLVALLFGLIVSFFNFWQIKVERKYLAELDQHFRNSFNVWVIPVSNDVATTGTNSSSKAGDCHEENEATR